MFPASKGKSRQFRKKTQDEDEIKERTIEPKIEEESQNTNKVESNGDEDAFEAKLKLREQRKTKKKEESTASKDKKSAQQSKSLLSFAEVCQLYAIFCILLVML